MTHADTRLAQLTARLTALDRERTAIVAEIEALRSAPAPEPSPPNVAPAGRAGHLIDRHSTIEAKIALFRRLFRGRADVFPVRWENAKTRRSGYAPACANEWQRGICKKPKVKCSVCPNQA
ncbi:MAG: TOTE conflict system archaeo-eukaryotic primase domain-containing protein [Phreatobacter sp.]